MPAITPEQALQKQRENLPEDWIEIINQEIVRNLVDNKSTVSSDYLIDKFIQMEDKFGIRIDPLDTRDVIREKMYERGLLTLRSTYLSVGWIVEFNNDEYKFTSQR